MLLQKELLEGETDRADKFGSRIRRGEGEEGKGDRGVAREGCLGCNSASIAKRWKGGKGRKRKKSEVLILF